MSTSKNNEKPLEKYKKVRLTYSKTNKIVIK